MTKFKKGDEVIVKATGEVRTITVVEQSESLLPIKTVDNQAYSLWFAPEALTPYTLTAQLNATVDKAMGVIRGYFQNRGILNIDNEHYTEWSFSIDNEWPLSPAELCAIADHINQLEREK